VWNVPPVFAIISIGCIMGFLIHPASQLLPAFAKEEIDVGSAGAGALLMAAGIGSVLATTVLAGLGDIPIKNWILLWAAILYGAALFVFAWTPSFAPAFILMLFVGGGRMAFVSIGTALIQMLVESGYAGRALSLWSLGVALMFVGALPLGLLGDEIGLRTAIAINAVLYLGATVAIGFIWPPIRSISRLRAQPVAGTPG
jgi:predicted MFS family arabinose efflux permease